MKRINTNIQNYSAIAMLFVGTTLSIIGFIVPPTGEISNSVLAFFGQCLVYAGSVFGIKTYMHNKFINLEKQIKTNEKN